MTTVAVTTHAHVRNAQVRLSFLQRLRMLFRRQPEVQPQADEIVAEPEKAPEIIHNLKYSPNVLFDFGQTGGQS